MRADGDPSPRSVDLPGLPTRQRVLILLNEPRCAREIRERVPGTRRKQIETVLQRLAQDRLIACVTPEIRQSRLYQRTYLGDLLVFEVLGELAATQVELSRDELRTRAYVQAGRYRRLVLRVVGEDPHTARELRKSILPMYARIGMGHTHQALRELCAKSIVRRDGHGRWTLTGLGEKLQAIELDGLPERPAISRSLWERIEPTKNDDQQQDPKGDKQDPDK